MRRFFVTAVALALLPALLTAACRRDGDPDRALGAIDAPPPAAAVPEARTEVSAAPIDGRILVAGGLRADGTTTARVDAYDLRSGAWSAAPALPVPLHHAGMAAFGDRVFVVGGYTPDGGGGWTESDRVWSLGGSEAAWRPEPPLLVGRGALGVAATEGGLVAFGGTGGGQVVASTEVLRRGATAWAPAPPMAEPREHLAATALDGRVYAIAGRVGGLDTNKASVESLDPDDPSAGWRPEPDLGKARGGVAAATVGDALCVAGGEEPGGTIASVECLGGDGWQQVATLKTPRHGLGVAAGEVGRLHVLAGGPEPGLFVSDAHEVLTIP